ncbi:MAG: tryptophan-rich sensory protein [Rhizobiales bacterium]|jgi:tryptophan-rich sensory protein|nr:tryptophan-rich sensory protein [Hyphomicrobiales bacterium]
MDQALNGFQSPWLRAAVAILPIVAASLLGQWATYPNLANWYAGLTKPVFNPPNWIFAPVWTTLYILMAWSVWRILKLPVATPGRNIALVFFFLQLALNAAWSWLFFGFNNPLAGLVNIVLQWIVILITIALFWQLDGIAAVCLVPLAAWVAFATLLNFEIWRLNG